MMPRMARTLVNLSLAEAGTTMLDPFCGTGGILIEAEMLGLRAVGSDFDPGIIRGSKENVKESDLLLADTTRLPIKDCSVGAVVTDFPYGQSVCIRKGGTMEHLYHDALEEINRVLKTRSRAVVVTHRDISAISCRAYGCAPAPHSESAQESYAPCPCAQKLMFPGHREQFL